VQESAGKCHKLQAVFPERHLRTPVESHGHLFADKASLIKVLHRSTHHILHRRRAGKIARLPAPVREQINLMLQDGLPYADIIAKLGEAGKLINKDNLSRWRKADHQDWLAEQSWFPVTHGSERSPAAREMAMLIHEFDSHTLRAASSRRPGTALTRVINSVVKMANIVTDDAMPEESEGHCASESTSPITDIPML
jgi:hypothetical protein